MSCKNIILIILSVSLLTGCSPTKSLRKAERREVRPDTEWAKESAVTGGEPAGDERRAQRAGKPADDRAEARKDTPPESAFPLPRPAMQFSDIESAHVRAPGLRDYSFPPSGELIVIPARLERDFHYPYPGKVISGYGMRGRSMHTGIDIKAIPNDTIRAAMPGVVRMSKAYSGYGNIIVIRHYNGLETAYGHNSRNLVAVNDVVEAGDAIALAGRTGRATTEHLHFEVRAGGDPIDPCMLVDAENRTLRSDTLYLYYRAGSVLASHTSKSEKELTLAGERAAPDGSAGASAVKASAAPPDNSASTIASTEQAAPSSVPEYYRVKKGDTLSAIARKFGTNVTKLCQVNGLKTTGVLQINQRLRVK